ncbi:MAG TPA: hypothetical protein DEH25_02715, partial [Chloroflexi bacterium]|nr:hypothetical protein [Chloroflexota bacterium]
QASELCQDNWGSSTQSQCDIKWFQDEEPQHTVYLDDFYMDQYEITNAQYAEFLNEAGNQSSAGVTWMNAPDKQVKIHQYGSQWRVDSGFANYPVIEVTWYGAQAYCAWRGGRLPTEAEWEKAARGGLEGNLYPWGDQTPSCDLANLNGCSDFPFEVGEFSPNGYKIYDMAGNLWEWVSDWYGIDAYTFSSDSNPTGPSTGTAKAIRGGGWGDWPYRLRVSQRLDFEPGKSDNSTGFRCARPIESEVAAAPQPQPTQDPFQSNGSCSSASPPCSYTVQDGDTFSKIAVSVYGDHIYTPVLMNFNRNPSGVRISLHPGDPIFVPSLENLPELNYPDCGSNVFPCQYTVNDGDTYKSIASEFYGNSSAAQLIENNNWDYDRNEDKLITLQLRSGVDIILPAP